MLFITQLDNKTWEYYGRWDNKFDYHKIVDTQCNKSPDEEIGILYWGGENYFKKIIGYAHLMFASKPSRKHSCGFGIVIHQDFQGRGIGTILMKEAIKVAKEHGIKKIWLHVYDFNKPAIALYNKFGFKREGVFVKEELKNGKYVNLLSLAKFL